MTLTTEQFEPDDLKLGPADYRDETLYLSLSGTAASVTSASGETDDDSTKTLKLTVTDGSGESWDGVEQTVTYPASCDTALEKAAAINDQAKGVHADVDTGHVVIVTDKTGMTVSIAIGTGTATTVWGTAVAGTGTTGTVLKGTLLARNSSTGVLNVYVSGGSNATGTPVAVMSYPIVFSVTGSKAIRAQFSGKVAQNQLVAHDVSGAVPIAAIQTLIANSAIVPVSVRDLTSYDN